VSVSTAEQQEVVDRLLVAIRQGDLQALLEVLAPDVVVVADGGGLVAAARRPIRGAERVAAFLVGVARLADFEVKAVWLNGSPAGRVDIGGELDTAVSLIVENGRITRIYAVRNPHKLARLGGVAALTRT
jgi:RNA polymerase sigma-70 factor (ECF subfamily)